MKRRLVIFRFNLVEVALALVILAIGLSSVMVLFPVGLKASQGSIADNNLGNVAERVAAYLQAKYTSSEVWKDDGTFASGVISDIISDRDEYSFNPEAEGSPTSSDFTTTSESSQTDGMSGLYQLSGKPNYYLYRQYSTVGSGGNDRAIDFEAIVRVGWDNETLTKQYYTKLDGTDPTNGTPGTDKIENYPHPRTAESGVTDPAGTTGLKSSPDEILKQCCRALIIEISWPADVPWVNREKRIFRVEMFNGNFVPYPQTTGTNP